MTTWRVWRQDGRYKLVQADREQDALRKVRRATRATVAYDRKHPAPGRAA